LRLASLTKEFSANTRAGGAALMTKTPGLPLSSFTVAAAARRSWIDGRTGTTQRSAASMVSLAVRSPGVSMKTHWRLVALMMVPTSRGVDLAHSGRGRVSGLDWNHCDTLAWGSTSKRALSGILSNCEQVVRTCMCSAKVFVQWKVSVWGRMVEEEQ
jgi:hypothetical protein